MTGLARTEIMENTITMTLNHFSMNVVTRVSKFSNFASKKFYSACRVAEDDGLVDLKLKMGAEPVPWRTAY